MSPRTLFVYGTLKPGKAPAEVANAVSQFRRVGSGTVGGELRDLGEYPGAVRVGRSKKRISGAVYELPDDPKILGRLDAYEEFYPERPHASLFLRQRTFVRLNNGARRLCWIYAYNPAS